MTASIALLKVHMIDAIGGRKVLVILATFLIGVGLVVAKGDLPPNFLTLLEFLVGFFMAGNVFEHAATAYTTVNTTATPGVDLTDVHAKLDAQSEAIATTQQGVGALVNYVNGASQK